MKAGSRSQNTIFNTIFGFINKVISTFFPFITRTVIIYVLGMEYAGLNNLFSAILQVLNLAELGISNAVIYCMYKPMADNDEETVCAILKYMRTIYRCIGIAVAVLGIVLIPFLKYFIKGGAPENLNILILYLFYLINTVIGYFFYAYKSTLLNAGQKNRIISNINTGSLLMQGIAQIVILVVLKDYYMYLLMMPVFTLLNNFWVAYATRKEYPQYVCRGNLNKVLRDDIKVRVKGLFVTKICITTRNAFDSIFVSSFIGLTTVAIYGNYYYIMAAVIGIISVITVAMTASVGNSLVQETVEKNYADMRKFNFVFNWIVGYCTACLLMIYQPFMKIWMGEDKLFPFQMVILFCVYFYFLNIGSIRAVYHDAAGLWWEARYRAIIEAILNLILNVVLTSMLGVFGTVLGTLISLVLVNYLYGSQIVFKYYFKTISVKEYFKDNTLYGIATLGICIFLQALVSFWNFSDIVEIVFRFIICTVVFNVSYYLIFRNTKVFKDSRILLELYLKKR